MALPSGLARMCPSTEYWRDSLAYLAGQVAEHGADGVYVEDIAACQAMACEGATHPHLHEGPVPAFWTAAVRSMLEAVRAAIGAGRWGGLDMFLPTFSKSCCQSGSSSAAGEAP